MVRGAFSVLALEPNHAGSVADGEAAWLGLLRLQKIDGLRCDRVDIEMPSLTGLELARNPRTCIAVKVVIVPRLRSVIAPRAGCVVASVEGRASRKTREALRQVHRDGRAISAGTRGSVVDHPLNERERRVRLPARTRAATSPNACTSRTAPCNYLSGDRQAGVSNHRGAPLARQKAGCSRSTARCRASPPVSSHLFLVMLSSK